MVLAGITLIKWRKQDDWSESDEMASDIAELQFMAKPQEEPKKSVMIYKKLMLKNPRKK